jgi:hypothetical protein
MINKTSNTGGKLIWKNTKLKHNFMNKKNVQGETESSSNIAHS